MAKPKTQADQRRDIIAVDQHGRPWLVCVELATGDPTGAIDTAGWSDPLRNTSKYVIVPKNAYGTQQWGTVQVDWPRWIREQEGYEQAYRTRFIEVGREMNKGTFDPEKWEQNPYLTELVGPRPWPSSAVLRMAQAGHQELLGLEPLGPVGRKLLGIQTADDLEAEVQAEARAAKRAAKKTEAAEEATV